MKLREDEQFAVLLNDGTWAGMFSTVEQPKVPVTFDFHDGNRVKLSSIPEAYHAGKKHGSNEALEEAALRVLGCTGGYSLLQIANVIRALKSEVK